MSFAARCSPVLCLHALGIFVFPSVRLGFCAGFVGFFGGCFFFLPPPASSTMTPILPSHSRELHSKLPLDTAKRKAGRGSGVWLFVSLL